MATPSRERQLIDNVWQYRTVDEGDGGAPTLAEVLAAGNLVGAQSITSADDNDGSGGFIDLADASDPDGGDLALTGGASVGGTGGSASLFGGAGVGGTGGAALVQAGSGDTGGAVTVVAGEAADSAGPEARLRGGKTTKAGESGGNANVIGGAAVGAGSYGGEGRIVGGTASDGGLSSEVAAWGASADSPGSHGKVSVRSNNSTGPGPLVSDGTYVTYSPAAFVDPLTATPGAICTALIAAGLMAAS